MVSKKYRVAVLRPNPRALLRQVNMSTVTTRWLRYGYNRLGRLRCPYCGYSLLKKYNEAFNDGLLLSQSKINFPSKSRNEALLEPTIYFVGKRPSKFQK